MATSSNSELATPVFWYSLENTLIWCSARFNVCWLVPLTLFFVRKRSGESIDQAIMHLGDLQTIESTTVCASLIDICTARILNGGLTYDTHVIYWVSLVLTIHVTGC